MSRLWLLVASSFAAVGLLTGVVRRYALRRAILDIPNHRSSHVVPTPRGGGLAIAAVTLVGTAVAALLGLVGTSLALALVGGGFLVAAVGWLDDRRGVPASARFVAHLVAALWAMWWIGGMPTVRFGTATITLGSLGWVVSTLLIVWFVNLYNFMDGIDGIAGGEALLVGGIGGALALLGGDVGTATIALLVAAAGAGFLLWNWPPARIFMGDVGSGLFGYLFAVTAMYSEQRGTVSLIAWCLLLGVFLVDATITLLRRVLRGERWYEAHHSHAYQRFVQAGWRHLHSTGAAMVLTGLLGLLAAIATYRPNLTSVAVGAGIALLALVYGIVERLRPMTRPETVSANRASNAREKVDESSDQSRARRV